MCTYFLLNLRFNQVPLIKKVSNNKKKNYMISFMTISNTSSFKRFKKIRPTKYQAIFALILTIIGFNILLCRANKNYEDKFIKSHLLRQLSFLHNLIKNDIQNIFENKNPEHLLIIKNYIYQGGSDSFSYEDGIVGKIYDNKGNSIIVDLSNILELINELAKNYFYYYVKLNGKAINKSPSNLEENYEIELNDKIFDNYLYIKINLLDTAWVKVESNKRSSERLLYTSIISVIFFMVISYMISKYYQSRAQVSSLHADIHNLREYFQQERSYINDCYEYSKKDLDFIERLDSAGLLRNGNLNDYLPLYLSPGVETKLYSLNSAKLNFENLVEGYNLITHSKIKMIISDQTTNNNIISSLESQTLLQLVNSITRNLLQFKMNTNKTEVIKITYFNNSIKFECNSIKLSKSHLIKWSKNIFDNTANPFILNFEQIFKILEIFEEESEVKHIDDNLVLTLKFKNTFTDGNEENYQNNIIHINRRKK